VNEAGVRLAGGAGVLEGSGAGLLTGDRASAFATDFLPAAEALGSGGLFGSAAYAPVTRKAMMTSVSSMLPPADRFILLIFHLPAQAALRQFAKPARTLAFSTAGSIEAQKRKVCKPLSKIPMPGYF
jgi:hypothetical protein